MADKKDVQIGNTLIGQKFIWRDETFTRIASPQLGSIRAVDKLGNKVTFDPAVKVTPMHETNNEN